MSSVSRFIFINAFILGVGHIFNPILRSLIFVLFFHVILYYKDKKIQITKKHIKYLILACIYEYTIEYMMINNTNHTLYITFPIKLFLFEIIFDFFHYVMHRFMHIYFRRIHGVHHNQKQKLVPLDTFVQHPIDIICTNMIPFICSIYLINGYHEYKYISAYKLYTEIAGHSGGLEDSSTTCFPLCVYIPRVMDIQLSVRDHTMHHQVGKGNYSKRFTLWDKLFGTYVYIK